MLQLNNPLFQSQFLYLQAAGSNGADGSSPGVHLRWDFRKLLKENHLPKGDLTQNFPSALPFNKPKDYVYVYRAPWHRNPLQIQFLQQSNVIDSGPQRIWEYRLQQSGNAIRKGMLFFTDVAQYDQLKASTGNDLSAIFRDYNGIFEFEVENQLFYYAEFLEFSTYNKISSIELETVSLKDTGNKLDRFVSCRKKFPYPWKEVNVMCEHIHRLRFRCKDSAVFFMRLDTYEDTILKLEEKKQWTRIGEFSLTLDDALADHRLEDPAHYVVNKHWPKFNETNLANGEFTVKVKNYRDRWFMPDGLKEGVKNYLMLSQTSPSATDIVPADDGQSNTELSYLSMLNFASLDYHVARMLGLGHIDDVPAKKPSELPFIYVAEYVTHSAMGPGFPAQVRTHYSMSLPTRLQDYRYPPVPSLKPVSYGLYYDNGSQQPTLISDAQGYVPVTNGAFDYVRYINLRRERFYYEKNLVPFFHDGNLFCTCQESHAVLYGLEYKEQSEAGFRRPEILHDDTFKDPAGLPEVTPIPEHGDANRALYVHEELEEGVHIYKLYSVNWFSRTFGQSNPQATDFTTFPKRNSLRPPANFAVQLIQPENPLMFTSGQEQTLLSSLSGDKTLARVTFDWTDIHNAEYQYADKAEFFFRENKPLIIEGKVTGVTNLSNGLCDVQTGVLHVTSVTPNYSIQPYVNNADAARFIGSSMAIGGVPHEVVQIVTTGNNPKVRVKRNTSSQVTEPDGDGVFIATESLDNVPTNVNFTLFEKMTETSSWDFKLTKEVTLVQFLPHHSEVENHSDGTSTTRYVGGIYKPATVTEIQDVYGPDDPAVTASPAAPPFAGDPIPGSHTGVFNVKFPGYTLNAHPDAGVEWYRGVIRIQEDASLFPLPSSPNYRPPQIKKLVVAKIVNSSPLELMVVDADFDPNSTFSNPQTEYMPIDTGLGVNVNYHPGYKLYLEDDTVGTNNFSESSTLPGVGQGRKVTFLGARSKDSTQAPTLYSSISTPSPLLALEIQEPVAPGIPTGPQYATRPDFYGKVNYSFDMEVDTSGGREPYAMIFYRADQQKILNAIYSPSTVASILSDLEALPTADAAFFNDRWNDLVNVNVDSVTHTFREYVPGGYRFPLPDNTDYIIPNVNPAIVDKPLNGLLDFSDMFLRTVYIDPSGTPVTQNLTFRSIVEDAIQGVFLPLTEQPVLYKYVKQGYQTSSEKPKIRDNGGNIIYPTPGVPIDFNTFDPFPMVTRFNASGSMKVRFTDYTLDGASTSFYFFFGVEMSNRMEVSDASPIAGPILLVNTMPAEEPSIVRLESRTANAVTGAKTGVKLEVNPYIGSEVIDKYQVFRATEYNKTTSVRTMDLVGEFAVDESIFDDFSDLNIPPFGDPLFYRVVALRKIKNEHDDEEWVPSKPSKVGLTNVIDVFNPPAPELSYQSDPPASLPPVVLTNVSVEWDKTTHNGAYHLYKLTSRGNWELIHTVRTNDPSISVDLATTTLNSGSLSKQDADGNTIYHHFKVVAENASGLLSVKERRLTV